ncbi:MAG: 50S ribosomal protein L35 [Patescibacteria group bacterium]|nr:50S ribosomal protein L35 [Patescibacteria group bacterium]
MPKLKIHKTAVKRFRVTKRGKIIRRPGSVSHLRRHETTSGHKRKEKNRLVKNQDLKRVKRLLNL